jgi:hypothetical protein
MSAERRSRVESLLLAAIAIALPGLWLVTRLAPDRALHDHAQGTHGGTIISLGRDEYHVEAVFESTGTLRLYPLAADESQVMEIEDQSPLVHVRAVGEPDATTITLRPDPQEGDTPGRTSRFVAELPPALAGRDVAVSIPLLRINGRRFRLAFSSPHDSLRDMPAKVVDDEERELYLTPGGIYTAADIAANGNVTASEKFRGFRAKHDHNPQPGDRLCPITRTKANPDCAWIIAGQTYEFCCPPCIDEFVRLAKESPDAIAPPEAYVQRANR